MHAPVTAMQRITWAQDIANHLCDSWGWMRGEPEAIRLGLNLASHLEALVVNTNTSPEALLQGLLPLGAVTKETRDAYVLKG